MYSYKQVLIDINYLKNGDKIITDNFGNILQIINKNSKVILSNIIDKNHIKYEGDNKYINKIDKIQEELSISIPKDIKQEDYIIFTNITKKLGSNELGGDEFNHKYNISIFIVINILIIILMIIIIFYIIKYCTKLLKNKNF